MHRRDLLRLLSLSALGSTARVYAAGGQAPGAFVPDVEFTLTAAAGEAAILPGAPSSVWRFSGKLTKGPADTLQPISESYLGPVINLRRGQKVRVHFSNQLGEPSIVHWHGLDWPTAIRGSRWGPGASTSTSSR